MEKIRVPVILGPTASGKSSLAFNLAKELGLSIISCDSRQIYKYLDIGTAKPVKDELEEVKHYMIDIVDPKEDFSSFAYQEMVLKIIREGDKKGERFIICGGTGLYFEALSKGVGPQISTDPEFIKKYIQKAEQEGKESVYNELKEIDPKVALKLHSNDLQRVIRALAVMKQEGCSILDLQNKKSSPEDIEFFKVILNPERDFLYSEINKRVGKMANDGLYNEFKALVERGFTQNDPGMRTVGYQEFFNLRNDTEKALAAVFDKIRQNSRKYAKRQYTWFKNREGGYLVDPMNSSDLLSAINKIKKFLDMTK